MKRRRFPDGPPRSGSHGREAGYGVVVVLLALVGIGASGQEVAPPSTAPAGSRVEAAKPYFRDVAAQAGLDRAHTQRRFDNPYARIMEGYTALGAAVAIADFDGDGLEDLFFTDSSAKGKNLLYRNRGDFKFEEVAERAGVAAGNDATNASADALFADLDNDGDPDLLVVRFGQSLLYENRDGSFRDITVGSGLERYLNHIAAIAFDYDRDGDLDLFYANYFSPVNLFAPSTPRFFPESFETAKNGGGLTLFRNEGGGKFTDQTAAAGLGAFSGWSLDLGHADADLDGDQDLFVAADFGTDAFYRNNGDGTFTDLSEKAIGIDTKKGMNAEWGDFNNDLLFDIYVTNITDEYMKEGNFLWANNGDLTFTDLARETGTHNTGWGWAGKFFDYDNDGWLDLYVVNGWVSGSSENYVLDIFELIVNPEVDLADARNWPPMGEKTLSGYQRNCLFRNLGGALFRNEAARHGMDSILDGRGIGLADFDHDGRVDLVVTNAGEKPILARNEQDLPHHFLQLRLEGTRSNRDAVGARVEIVVGGERRAAFVNGGNGFAGQSSRTLHFGLGKAAEAQTIEVFWPSGLRQSFQKIAGDRTYELREGGQLLPWHPAGPGKSP